MATILAAVPATAAAATPTVHELTPLRGYVSSDATAVNNLGIAVGYVTDANDETVAVKWSRSGAVTDLGTLPGDEYSEATGINDLGHIVGFSGSEDTAVEHAVEWNAQGVITDLGAAPGEFSLSDAYAINDLGEVVGSDQTGPRAIGASSWRHGTIDAFGLGQLDQLGSSTATAVNDLGTIAGYDFAIHGASDAMRWNADGSYLELPDLPDAVGGGVSGNGALANAINNLGEVVGYVPLRRVPPVARGSLGPTGQRDRPRHAPRRHGQRRQRHQRSQCHRRQRC